MAFNVFVLNLLFLYINSAVVSRFTLSLFEDSGWYMVNYEVGLTEEERLWGYSKCIAITATSYG